MAEPRPVAPSRKCRPRRWLRPAAGLALVAILTAGYLLLQRHGVLAPLFDEDALRSQIAEFGLLGPLLVISLMTGAIVFSPLPSAPIALAAGAAYGHLWGTVYILVGAELGALVAFALGRLLGRDIVGHWFDRHISFGRATSQGGLMAIVLVSRLLPFVSFDVVSYAAGLTPLAAWRFALATFVGILPASFLLAHFGGELASADGSRIAVSVLLLGALTLVPLLLRSILKRRPGDDRAA